MKHNQLGILADGEFEAGRHEEEWNGKDANAHVVASGVYFRKIVTDGFSEAKRMILMK